jgi:hypothetical protein
MSVTNHGTTGCVELESNTPGSGTFLQYSSVGNAPGGTAEVTWFVADPAGATAQFLNETLLRFLLSFDAANNGSMDITWEFCVAGTGGAACASDTQTYGPPAIPGPPPTTIVSWDLASFGGYGALLGAIGGGSLLDTVKLTIDADTNIDMAIDLVQFDTPEPSTFVLLGSALVGVALLRRRRKV